MLHYSPTLSVRVPFAVASKLAADPVARVNLSAFVHVVVDYFIAFEHRVQHSPTNGESLPLPRHLRAHWRRYAKAAGGRTVADLVASALAWHYGFAAR